ncbi:unnamed protein product [Acanthoscelides obtectus]|uniref:Cadherin domain-containing protein n=3 Tax=Acanthoscelides obtectus TaxID=200917 RepID=A0A9P0KV07_ACAOB|nr:unnamed protein product [Acanthoscelides obtectus]CAK1643399.1 Cadherin EGF LAG seven-pass G-type receptor 2 [Acanthoscelides obtectus]
MARLGWIVYTKYVIWLTSFFYTSSAQGLEDNRCFLENGASSENFFVPEDLPVGSNIGQIRVHGDPRPDGNIELHLKELDSPVAIAPGTKNLTLRRPLDKEGVDGPASVFVNLICERLETLDPGFVIPINIRVTDANDNAPVFINAPYVLNISEVTVVGTRVLQGVHAADNDQQGPFSTVKYSVLPGPHSDFFEFENELEGTLVLKKPLDYESLKTFDVHIRAQDHGEPPRSNDTVLTVHVIDADDQNPRFLDDRYTAMLPDPPKKGSPLHVKPRDIKAFDQDIGINAPIYYTFNEVGPDYSLFRLNRLTAAVTLAKDASDGELPHPAILVIRATQQDNPDRYALATLTVTKGKDRSIKFLHKVFHIKASEALPPGAMVGTLTNNRPGDSLRYFVSDQNILKTFSLNTKGEISLKKKLDYEEMPQYTFKVFATDGVTNDSTTVNVSVVDVNEWEPRFRYPHYEFFVAGAYQSSDPLGRIEAADGDKTDTLTLELRGANASLFSITPDGELRLKDGVLRNDIKGTAHLTLVATDSGYPPKKASVPVTVHFNNPGDMASIISSRGNGGVLLAGLGAILLILVFVVALLAAYIWKVKKNSQTSPTPPGSSLSSKKDPLSPKKVTTNPMFENSTGATRAPHVSSTFNASALGGVPTAEGKTRSPKVHPAPLPPPLWPSSASASSRVKKLSWGDDKTDTDSLDNVNNVEQGTSKLSDSSNLTVYF